MVESTGWAKDRSSTDANLEKPKCVAVVSDANGHEGEAQRGSSDPHKSMALRTGRSGGTWSGEKSIGFCGRGCGWLWVGRRHKCGTSCLASGVPRGEPEERICSHTVVSASTVQVSKARRKLQRDHGHERARTLFRRRDALHVPTRVRVQRVRVYLDTLTESRCYCTVSVLPIR
ncbi:hypothetical protein FGB62_102g015 [Gracilaria domingensis]|nr:hypothetical protein FGB62_102g015 [Gracilaria domingensis]